jgi:hypothetical protein
LVAVGFGLLLKTPMFIWRAGWFYTRLILANLQFLTWFFWEQYLTTQIVGVSFAWLLLAILLATHQLLAWQLPDTMTSPAWPTSALRAPLEWRLATTQQVKTLCQRLHQAQELQSTHRDVLINLSLCEVAQGEIAAGEKFWQAARKLDPNAQIFTAAAAIHPKNSQ